MDGMDHNHGSISSGSSSSSSGHGMMVPYLHFVGGDNLFFKAWSPRSAGAIAGACIGLFLLALLERWLHALRSVFSDHWRQRALSSGMKLDTALAEQLSIHADSEDRAKSVEQPDAPSPLPRPSPLRRTIAPFIAAYDIPRGVLYSLQTLLMYALMLAVMTFQAAYIISIIVGLGFGEILFGRAGHLSTGH